MLTHLLDVVVHRWTRRNTTELKVKLLYVHMYTHSFAKIILKNIRSVQQFALPESHRAAHDGGVLVVEQIVTDGAPLGGMVQLHPALVATRTADETDPVHVTYSTTQTSPTARHRRHLQHDTDVTYSTT